jgi:hypothetical protein
MQMVASRRYGRCALLDLRPVSAPYYPSAFQRYRFDPTVMISTLSGAQTATRSQQFYDHNRDDKSTSRQFGNVFEPEELTPRNPGRRGFWCAAPADRWSSSWTGPIS